MYAILLDISTTRRKRLSLHSGPYVTLSAAEATYNSLPPELGPMIFQLIKDKPK